MTKVYVVTFDDGDYYCEGGHIVGVFSDEKEAEGIAEKVKTNGIRQASYSLANGTPEPIVATYVTHVYETAVAEYDLDSMDCVIPELPRNGTRYSDGVIP